MARRRHDSRDAPDEDPGQGPAPADLLQMWISGRIQPSHEPPPRSVETEEAAAYDEPQPAPDEVVEPEVAQPEAPEPESAQAESAQAESAEPAPVDDPVDPDPVGTTAADDWWPTEAAGALADEPAADPSSWWPYAEETSAEPVPEPTAVAAVVEPATLEPATLEPATLEPATLEPATLEPATLEPGPAPTMPDDQMDTAADESLWQDDIESEWVEEDDGAEPVRSRETEAVAPAASSAPAVGTDPRTVPTGVPLSESEISAHRAGGWASFGAAPTAEDVVDRMAVQGPWSDRVTGGAPITPATTAEPAAPSGVETDTGQPDGSVPATIGDDTAEVTPGSTPSAQPSGLDMTSTAHWTLDDFEEYIRSQSGNELSEWIGAAVPEDTAVVAAEPPSAEAPVAIDEPLPEMPVAFEAAPDPVVDTGPADDASPPTPEQPTTPAVESPVVESVESPVVESLSGAPIATEGSVSPEAPSLVRGLLARMGLSREQDGLEEDPLGDGAVEDEQPAAPLPDGWQDPALQDLAPATVPQPAEVAEEPVAFAPELERTERHYDPDATEHYDFVGTDFDGPPPFATEEPSTAEDDASAAEVPPSREAVAEASQSQPAGEHAAAVADDDQDHQEWYDDAGLRWTSDDGGYTWFSTDGQGWNAEIGEPIEVPAVAAPATAVLPPVTSATPADDLAEDPPEGVAPPEPDEAPGDEDASAELAAEPEAEADAEPSEHWPEPISRRKPEPPPPAEEAGAADPTTSETADAAGPTDTGEDETVPQFVEYKPRGAHRPVLGVLFVAAAVFAVVAIFWAVSKGSQAATGIAVGITGFALAFWWGLLSWTPTVVSINGAILEVARGSDGERFDLRSPDLRIDLDDDTGSRNWRTTITRPNGTELVIPASAVDADEFSAVVRHYRADVFGATGSPADTDS